METITGEIEWIYYYKDGWASFRLNSGLNCAGNVPMEITQAMNVTLIGNYITNNYGLQFKFTSCKIDNSTIISFLSKCFDGIGDANARRIYQRFKDDSLDIILHHTDKLIEIDKIGKVTIEKIKESVKDNEDFALKLDIIDFFNSDITPNKIKKIVDFCDKDLRKFKKVKENPYSLIGNIEGLGFKRIDELAMNAGIKETDIRRIEAALVYSLQEASTSDGHCFLDFDSLTKRTLNLLFQLKDISTQTFNSIIKKMNSEDYSKKEKEQLLKKYKNNEIIINLIKNYQEINDLMADALIKNKGNKLIVIEDNKIYLNNLYQAETNVAYKIKRIIKRKPFRIYLDKDIEEEMQEIEENDPDKKTFSLEQQQAVFNSVKNNISIITGGPGRGKTFILKAVVNLIGKRDNYENIILLAPTGKAAKRMTESINPENNIGIKKATTIHRFLKDPIYDKYYDFSKKTIIIDEFSMCGILLFSNLLNKIEDSQIIIVGDVDQLASIEAGMVLSDLIKSEKITTSYLRKCFRNEGTINKNAEIINNGLPFNCLLFDKDTQFVEKENKDIEKEILKSYKELLKEYDSKEIGILSPLRQRGVGCVNNINKIFREEINKINDIKPEFNGFYENDRVMFTSNNYRLSVIDKNGFLQEGIFNGDIGTIEYINRSERKIKILFDDDSYGTFKYDEISDSLVLANAMTIHKSQGSEYKAVILIMASSHIFFLKRNLFYTGLTRGKKIVKIIGSQKAIDYAIRSIDDRTRNTFLKERIRE